MQFMSNVSHAMIKKKKNKKYGRDETISSQEKMDQFWVTYV